MKIYVDGSCSKNGYFPNTGGFGVVVVDDDDNLITTYREQENNTTNNRQEIKAIIYALRHYGVKPGQSPPEVYSDSNLCVQTFNIWMYNWERNGWIKSSDNKPPENLDLIKEYYNLIQEGYRINLIKIKGHYGHKWNEMADRLAVMRDEGENNETFI